MIPVGSNLQLKNMPVITISLIIINTIIFIIECFFIEYFDYDPVATYFISLFSVFLHADFYHLFGNMLFLWIFGSYLEDKIGSKRFLFYYFVCEIGAKLLDLIIDGRPGIGASGAIAGVMGIYLYRCHHSKIKTIVPVGFWFAKININARWFLLYWIFMNLYDAFYVDDYVAYWAHVGGYLTGIVIGMFNNYWQEAKIEKLYERAIESIRTYNRGIDDAEKNLHKILRIDPDNTDAHLEIARYYSLLSPDKEKAKKHYLAAARIFYGKENFKNRAGEIFLEYLERYREPQEPALHLKYADTLSNVWNYGGAARILEPLLNTKDLRGSIGDKVFINLITFSLKADLKECAQNAFEQFKVYYPDSSKLKMVEALLRSYKPVTKTRVQIEKATTQSNRWTKLRDDINETTSDWVYWSVVLFAISLFGLYLETFLVATMISFVVTVAVRKCSSFWGSIYEGGYKSEAEGLRDYNISSFMNKARACERNENYDDAIEYLKAVIEEDKKGEYHLEVRHKLAWLYHKKVNQPQKAIQEYKAIFKIASKYHPFRREAYEGIKELSQSHASIALVQS